MEAVSASRLWCPVLVHRERNGGALDRACNRAVEAHPAGRAALQENAPEIAGRTARQDSCSPLLGHRFDFARRLSCGSDMAPFPEEATLERGLAWPAARFDCRLEPALTADCRISSLAGLELRATFGCGAFLLAGGRWMVRGISSCAWLRCWCCCRFLDGLSCPFSKRVLMWVQVPPPAPSF